MSTCTIVQVLATLLEPIMTTAVPMPYVIQRRSLHPRPSQQSPRVGATRLQCKLEVGSTDDPLEVEADRLADQVMRTPVATDTHGASNAPETPRAGDAEGTALPDRLRDFFEPRFGRSFQSVRLSTGPRAQSLAARLGAKAFTVDDTIGFAQGAFKPDTFAGRWLLAHELAHVTQHQEWGTRSIVHRSPPEGESQARNIARAILEAESEDTARSLIDRIDSIDLAQAVREVLVFHYSDTSDPLFESQVINPWVDIEMALLALDNRARELIARKEVEHEAALYGKTEVERLEFFIARVERITKPIRTKTKGKQRVPPLQAADAAYLERLLDRMSPATLKRVEQKLLLWPKGGISNIMKTIIDLVTARTRKPDAVESSRGRFDTDTGEALKDTLDMQSTDYDDGSRCLEFIDEVAVGLLWSEQPERVAAADDFYRDRSNYNESGLHSEATLSILASQLRVKDLLGPVTLLAWNEKQGHYEPAPHDVFKRLSSAGDGWYYFLVTLASYHTIIVAVHARGGSFTYYEIDNHGVTRRNAEKIDEEIDSYGAFQKVPSRIWQVYTTPQI